MKETVSINWVQRMVIGVLPLCLLTFLPFSLKAQGLKDALGKYFLIGAAINQWQSDGQLPDADAVIYHHFNCAVAEICM